MRGILAFALGVGVACASFSAAAQQKTIKLTFASGYPSTFTWTDEEVNVFLPGVNKELEKAGSPNRIEWNIAVGGTLATMPNMLDAMSTGLADVGHVVHLFEPVRLPLHNVVSIAPFGSTDPRIATKALHDLHKTIPAMNASWDKLNLVYLTSFSFDSYLLILRSPISKIEDLRGRKIAAAAANLPWLESTGAVGISGTAATAYSDLKSGVFDGAINSAMLSIGGKLYEVAPHVIKTNFGAINAFEIVVNKTRWATLPADVQKALRTSADNLQESVVARIARETEAAFATMERGGAKITQLSREETAKWANGLPQIAERWAKDLEAKGLPAKEVLKQYVNNLKQAGVDMPRDWSAF